MVIAMIGMMLAVGAIPLLDAEETDAAETTQYAFGIGRNENGQQGNGTIDNVLTPTQIGTFSNVTQIVSSSSTTLFIDSGKLYGMGRNDFGQIGTGNRDNVLTPTQIGTFSNVTQVASSDGTTLFIDSGKLYGMGENDGGRIGMGNMTYVLTPTQIGTFSNVTQVASSVFTTLFIDSGKLYGTGINNNGQIGTGNTDNVLTPTQIGTFSNVTQVASSTSTTLFIDSGNLYAMGTNYYGQIGTGNRDNVLTPTQIGTFSNVTQVASSSSTTLFIDSGKLYGMGRNEYGQIGTGNTDVVFTPTQIGTFTNVTDISASQQTTYFLNKQTKYTATIESNNIAYGTVSSSTVTNIEYGTAIQVSGNTLTIGTNTVTATPATETVSHTYAFNGWYVGSTPLVTGTVVNDMAITAQFTATLKTFTVPISANPPDAGSVSVDSITVPYGSVMTVNGQTLTIGGTTVTATVKDSDTQYTYAWIGWLYNGQPVVSGTTAISGTAPITASMSKEVTTYTVTWIYGPASERITETETYAYGETPSHADPPALSEIEPFKEWSPAISPVTGSITYTAVYSDPVDRAPSVIILVLPYIVAVGMIIATVGLINSRNEGKWEKGDYLQLIIGLTISIVALATILIPLCNVLA